MSLTEDQITAQNFKDFFNIIKPYFNNTTNMGFTPVGTIIAVMGKTAPNNYLSCEGQIVNISDYPELANYFTRQFEQVNYFGGDGISTFGIPDLKGEFLRGAGINSHANQGNGADVGVHQDGTSQPNAYGSNPGSYNHIEIAQNLFVKDIDSKDRTTKNVSLVGVSTYTASSESYFSFIPRPTNTSVLYCIATKNIYVDAKYDYSFDEKVIGTWTDGKPLYQKTIDIGNLPNATSKEIALNISNLDHICDMRGIISFISNENIYDLPIPNAHPSDNKNAFQINRRNDSLVITTGTNRSSATGYITIQYTKTTD